MAREWATVPLESLIEPNRGISYGIVQPGVHIDDGVPIVRVTDVRNGRIAISDPLKVSPTVEAAYARTRLQGGELLLTLVGTVGEAAVVPKYLAGWNTARAVAVIPVRQDVGSYWVKLALQSPVVRQIINSRLNTTVQATLNLRDVAQLPIVLPPAPEQRAIAHILGTLDDKIELNRRTSETLEAMARALFKSWFVDFDPVRAKLDGRWQHGQSLPGLHAHLYDLFPDRLVDSELGEIPEGWEPRRLGDFVGITKGVSYKSSELLESDIALVTLKSFERGGGYRQGGLKAFVGSYKSAQIIAPGEIVVACTDVTQHALLIGRTAVVPGHPKFRTLVASLDTVILRPTKEMGMTRSFLYLLGRADEFVAHTYAHTSGTTVLHLAKDAILSFTFAAPPATLMAAFDQLASPMFDQAAHRANESRTLAALRDALLPRLISGELRVPEAMRLT